MLANTHPPTHTNAHTHTRLHARACACLPTHTHTTTSTITITIPQGEVMEQQFGEKESAFHTMDLYTSAVLEATLAPFKEPPQVCAIWQVADEWGPERRAAARRRACYQEHRPCACCLVCCACLSCGSSCADQASALMQSAIGSAQKVSSSRCKPACHLWGLANLAWP